MKDYPVTTFTSLEPVCRSTSGHHASDLGLELFVPVQNHDPRRMAYQPTTGQPYISLLQPQGYDGPGPARPQCQGTPFRGRRAGEKGDRGDDEVTIA